MSLQLNLYACLQGYRAVKPEDKFWGEKNRFIYCCNVQQKSHFLVVNISTFVFICLIKQRLYVERQLKSFHLFAQT